MPQAVLLFRVRIVLRMTKPARLHAHPAAALYALLACANGTAREVEPAFPDGVLLDAPEQCRTFVARGEEYAFGCQVLADSASEAAQRIDVLLNGLRKMGRHAAAPLARGGRLALGGNFEVVRVEDLVRAATHRPGQSLAPVPFALVCEEAARAQALGTLTLRFVSPLRCHRSKRSRPMGHAFFDRHEFDPVLLLSRLRARLSDLGFEPPPLHGEAPPEVAENRLVWLDLSYGPRQARKALGGALGRVVLHGVGPAAGRVLALGQWVRVGESTRFGFGDYRIEELGPHPFPCRRTRPLLELVCRDGVLDELADEHELASGVLAHAARELCAGDYEPRPSARVEIASAAGKTRILAIPSLLDRALQRAVLRYLAPALDLFLEESSLAYRQGLGRHRAADRVRQAFSRGYRWALKSDFSEFFDSVDHRELRARLETYVADDGLVAALMRWVQSGAAALRQGIPQGAPVSPLLANLFLDEFDEHVAALGAMLVRYGDDFLMLFRCEHEARHAITAARQAAEALQLELNGEKTRLVDTRQPFDFLGFHFERRAAWEFSPRGEPALLEEIGWHEARRPASPSAEPRLSGETAVIAASPQATVIWGPEIESLHRQGGQLLAHYADGRAPSRVRIDRVRELVLLGLPTLPRATVRALADYSIHVLLTDDVGRSVAALHPSDVLEDSEAVAGQVAAARDEAWRLEIARRLISAKLRNYAVLADAFPGRAWDRRSGPFLRELAEKTASAVTVDELVGLEGAGAAQWYGQFAPRLPAGFALERRVAPHADDPVNVMLNIAHTVLHRVMLILIRQAGLAAGLGILHRPRAGHAALASDLQEPFRHLMDRAVLEAAPKLRTSDFTPTNDASYPLRVAPRAAKLLVGQIHRTLAIGCQGRNQPAARPYRIQAMLTVQSLRLHLRDPSQPFGVFEHP
jgi:CRISP-associated protein Cas1